MRTQQSATLESELVSARIEHLPDLLEIIARKQYKLPMEEVTAFFQDCSKIIQYGTKEDIKTVQAYLLMYYAGKDKEIN